MSRYYIGWRFPTVGDRVALYHAGTVYSGLIGDRISSHVSPNFRRRTQTIATIAIAYQSLTVKKESVSVVRSIMHHVCGALS